MYIVVQICTFMYNTGMSKGISKFQLALTEKKSRRVEAINCRDLVLKGVEDLVDSPMKRTIKVIVDDAMEIINERIKEINLEIADIEGRVPNERI